MTDRDDRPATDSGTATDPGSATDSRPANEADLGEMAAAFARGELPMTSNPQLWADPFPLYRHIRETTPVLRLANGEHLLTRWDDCERVLRDTTFSSNPIHRVSDVPIEQRSFREQRAAEGLNSLLFLDPPDHTRLRKLVSAAFTPRRVEALRPRITEIADGILDRAADDGGLDVVADLGFVLPVTVICELLGIPPVDREQFGPWSSDATRLLDGAIDQATMQKGVLALMELVNYLNVLFDERRAHPGDDLISGLIAVEEEGDRLTEGELRSIVLLLFLAGHETTMNLIGNGTWALLRHPDQLRRLQADPTLIGSAVEELLRFDGPVHLTGRTATAPAEVGGVRVEAGEAVVTLTSAANRDPAHVADPEVLDIGRTDNRHLTFSHGIHYCLGASLARLEGQIAIGSLVARFPALAAAETPTYRDHFVLRGLNSLAVTVR